MYTECNETDLTYLANWYYYRTQLTYDIKPIINNAIFVTDPYLKLVESHSDTLINIYEDESSMNNTNLLNFKGILYSKDWGCFLELNGSKSAYTLFDKISGIPQMSGHLEYNPTIQNWQYCNRYYLSKIEESHDKSEMIPILYFICSVILSKMNDGKQVVIVPPHGKTKTKHEKYVNDNPICIKVWDMRMFNTYVRLEGFPVSGHFRHQRVGEGRTNHRLIWINEFEKHGYNRKYLKNQPN